MEHLSRALANKVGGALHYPPEQIEVLAYGFFGLLQTAFLLAGTALLGWAIGAFWPCLAASLLARSVSRPPLLAAYLAGCALCLAVVGARAPVESRCSVKSAAKGCGGAH